MEDQSAASTTPVTPSGAGEGRSDLFAQLPADLRDRERKAREHRDQQAPPSVRAEDHRLTLPEPTIPDPDPLEEERRQHEQARRRKAKLLDRLIRSAGERYRHATLENYSISCEVQRDVLREIEVQGGSLYDRNLVLFGNVGTGKDHILVACAKRAIQWGCAPLWVSGPQLYLGRRELIGTDHSEVEYVRQFVKPDILIVSDPVPAVGDLTNWNRELLYMIVDARYRAMRSTWCSLNVSNSEEAESLMGPQVVDRLRHGGLALFCDWESYRKGSRV